MIEMAIKLSNEPSQRQTLAHASFSCPTPKPHEGCKLVHRSSINQLKKKTSSACWCRRDPKRYSIWRFTKISLKIEQ